MQLFIFLMFLFIITGCSTIEVAKEISKATSSIKTSVEKIKINKENIEEDRDINNAEIEEIDNEDFIKKEKEKLKQEKENEVNLAKKQKKIIEIEILGKTYNELSNLLGDPQLLREDGNTKLARFDTSNCRIFVFFNLSENKQRVEHFEIRDQQGELIKTKEKIQHCYKNFGLA